MVVATRKEMVERVFALVAEMVLYRLLVRLAEPAATSDPAAAVVILRDLS